MGSDLVTAGLIQPEPEQTVPEQKAHETSVAPCTPIRSVSCMFPALCSVRGLLRLPKMSLSGSSLDNSIQPFCALLPCEVRYTNHNYRNRFQVIFLVSLLAKVTHHLQKGFLPAVLRATSYIWRNHSVKKLWGPPAPWRKGGQAQNHSWQSKGLTSQGPAPQHPDKATGQAWGDNQVQRTQVFR